MELCFSNRYDSRPSRRRGILRSVDLRGKQYAAVCGLGPFASQHESNSPLEENDQSHIGSLFVLSNTGRPSRAIYRCGIRRRGASAVIRAIGDAELTDKSSGIPPRRSFLLQAASDIRPLLPVQADCGLRGTCNLQPGRLGFLSFSEQSQEHKSSSSMCCQQLYFTIQ